MSKKSPKPNRTSTVPAHRNVGRHPQEVSSGADGKKAGIVAVSTTTISAGPIPSPDDLYHYNQVVPGAGERILAMAEKQAQHRQEQERIALAGEISTIRLGQWLGFTLSVVVVIMASYIAINAESYAAAIVGGLLGLGGLGSLVTSFIYSHRSKSKS